MCGEARAQKQTSINRGSLNVKDCTHAVEKLENKSMSDLKELDTKSKHLPPCDVTLVVGNDGKEFKAHRDVLAQSSPFFQTLLNTDMKENREGIIRLEVISEPVMKDILEFIYTGVVEMLVHHTAKDLIKASDYLLLSNLKTYAGKFLERTICLSNCLSYLNFAERYRCEELVSYTKNFIHANFPAITEFEEFLNLSSQEVERWISSDDIVVSAEEDVFKIICKWIEQKKRERKARFNELFRHVRLIYLPRDYLSKKLLKNKLVKNNEHSAKSVTSAIDWLDRVRELDLPRPQSMRKSMGKHVLVIACLKRCVCYVPDTHSWLELPKSPLVLSSGHTHTALLATRRDKVYNFSPFFEISERYDPLFNRWTALTKPTISEVQEGEEIADDERVYPRRTGIFKMDSVTVIDDDFYAVFHAHRSKMAVWKYDLETVSWRFISSFHREENFLELPCVVFVDKFVYAMGGIKMRAHSSVVTDEAARLDISENNWEEIAHMQVSRYGAFGVAAKGNIFVAGGNKSSEIYETSCEVYNIEANEWHFIESLRGPCAQGHMLCYGTNLYVVGGSDETSQMWIEIYDIEKNKWTAKAVIPPYAIFSYGKKLPVCLARIPKRTLDTLQPLC